MHYAWKWVANNIDETCEGTRGASIQILTFVHSQYDSDIFQEMILLIHLSLITGNNFISFLITMSFEWGFDSYKSSLLLKISS